MTTRRYPPYAQIADPYQRRRAIVDLHAQGSNTSISAYLETPRHRVYEVLQSWATEGHARLDDKPSTPLRPAHKVTMSAISEVRKLVVESPELGAYRVRAALEQIGIELSQATCGRLLALNRHLYWLPHPKGGAPRQHKEMPFRASFRHEWWSVDVRYIEEHNLGFPEPIYIISILENYSRAILASKISRTQNLWDYLEVLFAALATAGAPKGLVSDGGGIFYSTQAMDVYAALGIRDAIPLAPDDWVLYWRTPDPAPARGTRKAHEIIQQVLFDLAEVEQAVGGEDVAVPHPWLRVVPKDPARQTEE